MSEAQGIDKKPGQDLLDPAVVERAAGLELLARRVVEGFIAGTHRSPHHGSSVEFSEYRAYGPGDEPRHLDWRLFGRSDRYYVRRYEEETNLKGVIAVDASASMQYGGEGRITKLAYGSRLAAALAYLMLRQRDSAGVAWFDDRLRTFVPPRGSWGHLPNLLHVLAQDAVPARGTDLSTVLGDIAARMVRRELLVLISDLLDDPQRIEASLASISLRGHDVMVLQVVDPDERELPMCGPWDFQDAEEPGHVRVDADAIRLAYRERVNAFHEDLRSRLTGRGIAYHCIDTAIPLDQVLVQILGERQEGRRVVQKPRT